jgi:hypothetical protein
MLAHQLEFLLHFRLGPQCSKCGDNGFDVMPVSAWLPHGNTLK